MCVCVIPASGFAICSRQSSVNGQGMGFVINGVSRGMAFDGCYERCHYGRRTEYIVLTRCIFYFDHLRP